MTTFLENSINEKKLATFWLWIELLVVGLCSCLLAAFYFVGKCFTGKSLYGNKILVSFFLLFFVYCTVLLFKVKTFVYIHW